MSLIDAVYNNDLQQVKCLVENGVNIHVDNDISLRHSARHGYIDIVKYLVEHGANIHTDNDEPLYFAVYYNHFDIIKYLISLYSISELKELIFKFDSFYVKFLILERLYNESYRCS
ncbi:ankyrin repeat domain-containing protein [Candidatus Pacearchaeota archaeon]|jgi:ankyrin repeat protein|nr:ankyrin repeat domain-containing protein [Candidatus Pacearchaeota archaeon]